MIENHLGEFAALLTAIFWTVTALAFESASRRIGSLQVNILRLMLAFVFLSIYSLIRRNLIFPTDASAGNWFWLIISGLIGFVFGDLFLFKSYTIIGSRFAMLIMTLVPPITVLLSWIILGESLIPLHYAGMTLTFIGISMAVFSRKSKGEKLSLKIKPLGILYAFCGAVGQALGLVLSKFGLRDYDAFAGTQIRVIAGIIGFSVLVTFMKRWRRIISALSDISGMKSLSLGAFFGPFLGVSFSLVAVKYTQAGIASTIMALVPILIILPAVVMYREKITLPEIAGAFISVSGTALMFL
jgi:drug/metabolite transporter (DMT)-like permease